MNNAPHANVEYGSFWLRLLAVICDALILLPLSAFVMSLFAATPFIALCANLAINGFYYVGFLRGPWRATPGKRVMGLYVVHTDHMGALSKEEAWFRFVTYHLPMLPFYSSMLSAGAAQFLTLTLMGVWFLPVFFDKERAAMYDKICHTRVMKGRL